MPKRALRRQMLAIRRSLNREAWLAASLAAQHGVIALEEYRDASCVALYSPVHNEIDTAVILQDALRKNKHVLYPAVRGHDMVLRQVDHLQQLQEGSFGILEPTGTGRDHKADEADLIVVPGVVFDRTGHRIGFGKGFYDRFLWHPAARATLIGLCHDFQLIAGDLPADRHDVRMDIIVTDQRLVHCRSNRHRPGDPDSHRGG